MNTERGALSVLVVVAARPRAVRALPGLQKLHDMSVLHRDISCRNVLLKGDPAAGTEVFKISHFSAAKVLDDARATADSAAPSQRPPGELGIRKT